MWTVSCTNPALRLTTIGIFFWANALLIRVIADPKTTTAGQPKNNQVHPRIGRPCRFAMQIGQDGGNFTPAQNLRGVNAPIGREQHGVAPNETRGFVKRQLPRTASHLKVLAAKLDPILTNWCHIRMPKWQAENRQGFCCTLRGPDRLRADDSVKDATSAIDCRLTSKNSLAKY